MTKFEQFSFPEKDQDFIRFLDLQKHVIMLAFGVPNTVMPELKCHYGVSVLNPLYKDYRTMKIIEKYQQVWNCSNDEMRTEIIKKIRREVGI